MPFSAYFLPHASVFAVFFNSCANKTHGVGRLQWQKNTIPHNHMNLSFTRWITLTITLPWRIVLLNSPTPSENSYFCSILQSPWLARGPTPGASRGHVRYSSTRMFLANSGAVAQEKSKTRKQESPAHIYQSEIEGKAVLK